MGIKKEKLDEYATWANGCGLLDQIQRLASSFGPVVVGSVHATLKSLFRNLKNGKIPSRTGFLLPVTTNVINGNGPHVGKTKLMVPKPT